MRIPHASLAVAALLAAGTAHGQVSTSFESPMYTAGISIVGHDGWTAGDNLGGSQLASSQLAYSGGQSLMFDNSSQTDFYSVKRAISLANGAAYAFSAKMYVGGATGLNREYGLYLGNDATLTNLFGTVFGMTLSGDGTIRGGKSYDAANTAQLGKANAGTFANRWLSIDMTLDGRGNGTMSMSGFSDNAVYVYTFGSVTTPTNVQLGSDWLVQSSNYAGSAFFDNVVVAPQAVPEPGALAALGLGAATLLRRRRGRA